MNLAITHATAGQHQQQIAKRCWRSVAFSRLVLTADHGDNTYAPRLFVTVSIEHPLRDALFSKAPIQVAVVDANGVEETAFARDMPIVALLNIAGPAPILIGHGPAGTPYRAGQIKARTCGMLWRVPGAAVCRVFQNTAPPANRAQRRCEATPVSPKLKLMRFTGRAVPKPAPTLTLRMRDNRMWAAVQSCISCLVPRIDAGQAEVAAPRFDKKCGDGQ